jgi:large subunit ribosomal protein L9
VAAGIEAVKANVRLPEGPFKAVGEYEVEVALHTDAVANITVAVVPSAE